MTQHLRIERRRARWIITLYCGWPEWTSAKHVGQYGDWAEAMRAAYGIAYPVGQERV